MYFFTTSAGRSCACAGSLPNSRSARRWRRRSQYWSSSTCSAARRCASSGESSPRSKRRCSSATRVWICASTDASLSGLAMGFLGVDANTRTIAAGDQDTLAPAQPETEHRVAHGAGGGTDGKGHDLCIGCRIDVAPEHGDDVDRALRDAHERVLQPLRRYREQQEGRFRVEQDRDPLALALASDDPTHIISR